MKCARPKVVRQCTIKRIRNNLRATVESIMKLSTLTHTTHRPKHTRFDSFPLNALHNVRNWNDGGLISNSDGNCETQTHFNWPRAAHFMEYQQWCTSGAPYKAQKGDTRSASHIVSSLIKIFHSPSIQFHYYYHHFPTVFNSNSCNGVCLLLNGE